MEPPLPPFNPTPQALPGAFSEPVPPGTSPEPALDWPRPHTILDEKALEIPSETIASSGFAYPKSRFQTAWEVESFIGDIET